MTGAELACRYGLFNVVGNVWEWVLDPWSVDRSRAVGPGGALAAVAEAEALRKQELREQGPQAVSSDERVKKGGSYMVSAGIAPRMCTS